MLALLLAALAAGPHQSLDLNLAGGRRATASGIVSWDSLGDAAWYGAPAATISCVAAASGGDLACSGATATKHGAPTTVAAYGLPVEYAVQLSNANNFTIGDAPIPTTGFWMCVQFRPDSITGVQFIVGAGTGTNNTTAWAVFTSGAYVIFRVNSGGAFDLDASPPPVVLGQWNTYCASYDGSPGNGSAVLRGNLNGVANSMSTGPAPLVGGVAELGIGNPVTDWDWAGSVQSFQYGLQSLSASELAALVASQQAKLADKPLGASVSFASDGGLCCPASDSQCFWLPANVPCVSAAGTWLGGASANQLSKSQPCSDAWTCSSTVTLNDAVAPDGTTTATKLAKAIEGAESNYHAGLTIAAASALSVYLKAGTALGVTLADNGLTHKCDFVFSTGIATPSADTTCTVETLADGWYRVTAVVPSGGSLLNLWMSSVDEPVGHYLYAWGAQAEPGTVPTLYHATAGAPYSGSATVASVVTTITNPAKWCIGVWANPARAWSDITTGEGLLELGTYAADNTAALFVGTGVLSINMFSGGSYRAWSQVTGFTGSDAHRIVLCQNGADSVVLYADDTPVALGAGFGAGTGLMGSIPASFRVGALTGYTGAWDILKVCQGNTYSAVARCLQ